MLNNSYRKIINHAYIYPHVIWRYLIRASIAYERKLDVNFSSKKRWYILCKFKKEHLYSMFVVST